MADKKLDITRQQIIVVDEVGQNTYGDLTFTDKEGKEYKVSEKRKSYFDKVIIPGKAVQLNYAVAYGKEFIYSASLVEEGLPKIEAHPPKEAKPSGAMSKDDWGKKDMLQRKSIERQTSLKCAVEVASLLGEGITTAKIIATAKQFEAYLEG